MQISENLPQFEDSKTLIIVSSTQSADLYIANAGEIEKMTEIRTEKIDHDDQVGHFERNSKGKTLGAGGTDKDDSQRIKDRFNNDLKEALADIDTSDIEQTILISSPQDKPTTKEQIPTNLQKTIILEIDGNHVGDHPDDILEKIKKAGS